MIHQYKSLKDADTALAHSTNKDPIALPTSTCDLCRYIWEVYISKPLEPSTVSANDATSESAVCMPPDG